MISPGSKATRLVAMMTVIAPAAAATHAAQNPPRRQGNVWGVCLDVPGEADTTGTVRLLGLARHMVGDWGYLRPGATPTEDLQATRRAVAMVRAHRLIPISGGAYPDEAFCEPGKPWPRLDPDGTMRTAARAKAAVWRKAQEAGIPFYVIEVLNEINGSWPADRYAQWLYDLAVEVKQAYPGLKVCSCGMAGSGSDYYDELLRIKPALKQVVDFWGLHPYGANHPPEYGPAEVSLRAYELTAAVLKKHGVSPIRLMCTETGYELEFSATGKDAKYPPIDDHNRAEYLARAFRDYYVPDARIECVTPFMLWDFPWHNWNGWDFMHHDGRPRPVYGALAAVQPKTGGRDWMPTGTGRIRGRITWGDTGIGVPRVVVYSEPGFYGAVTDDEGRFDIREMPEGTYRVSAFRDGYTGFATRSVSVRDNRPATFNGTVDRVSLIAPSFGRPGEKGLAPLPAGWSRIGSVTAANAVQLDDAVAYQGRRTLRIRGSGDGDVGVVKYGGYSSAYPSEVFIAEVHVRAEAARPRGGPWLAVDTTNGRGEVLGTGKAFAHTPLTDGCWHRITAAVFAPARSSRVRVSFGVERAAGTFYFSEPFVGEADFPLPSDARLRTTGYVPPLYEQDRRFFGQAAPGAASRNPSLPLATITGTVADFRGRALAGAAVASDAPLFVGVTDARGTFTLSVPADAPVRVRAFALGETPAISERLTLHVGEKREMHLRTSPPPAPPTLVNGGFNTFHPKEAGLITGWSTFGTTDGACRSRGMIFEVPSLEGEGLYFAQSGSNTKNGGAYQIVQAVPGRRYRLSGSVYTRTEGEGRQPLDNNCRLGIDPTGGRDPDSPDIVWTASTESEQKWTPLSVEAVAKTSRITVFLRHEMRRANTWNLTLFDDVRLETAPEPISPAGTRPGTR